MKPLIIRLFACFLWIISGILTNTPEGRMSAAASVLFVAAMLIEYNKKGG